MKKLYTFFVFSLLFLTAQAQNGVDLQLIRPIINTNDSNGGFYSEFYIDSYHYTYFAAEIKNNGSATANGVILHVDHVWGDSTTIIESAESDPLVISPGQDTIIYIAEAVTFGTSEMNSSLKFSITSTEPEINPADNIRFTPWTVFSGMFWTSVSRSLDTTYVYNYGAPGNLQPGDEFGFTLYFDEGWPHYMGVIELQLAEPLDDSAVMTGKLYRNDTLISTTTFQNLPNPWYNWYYSNPFNENLEAGYHYFIMINIEAPQGTVVKVRGDTSAYHNFPAETVAKVNGNFTTLDFVPVMKLLADPEGVAEHPGFFRTAVYPNPAHGQLTVESDLPHTLEILSSDGKMVMKDDHSLTKTNLNISRMNPGLYLVRIISGDKAVTRKVTVY